MKQIMLLLFALSFLLPVSALSIVGKESMGVALEVSDNGKSHMTLRFGNAPGATMCIDPKFGEAEYPPKAPLGLFDVRFIDHRDNGGSCLGQGVVVDIHPPLTCGTPDTFLLSLQPGDGGYPMHLSWPAGLSKQYDALHLADPNNGNALNVNMLKVTSATIPNDLLEKIYIIAEKCASHNASPKRHAVHKKS